MAYQGKPQALSVKSKAQKRNATNQKRPRASKNRKSRIPPPQAARIMQRYVAGENIREIARVEGRDRGTVTRIVKSEQMQTHVQQMRQLYFGLAGAAMESVYRALQQSSDGRLGHEILRNLGVIPNAEELSAIQRQMQQTGPMTEEELVKAEMLKLLTGACERAQMYGHPKPRLEDFKTPLRLTGRTSDRKPHELE
jgi:hypothetical protein